MSDLTPNPSPVGEGKSKHLRKVETLEKLLTVFTEEQLAQLAEVIVMTVDVAVMRECDQSVTLAFNNKGLVRYFNASNNVHVIKPVSTYKAE